MSCFHPKKFIKLDNNFIYPAWLSKTSKYSDVQYGMIPSGVHEIICKDKRSGCAKVIKEEDFILAGCGQCAGCRLAESVERANRCVLEAKNHENNYFLTLTYDDDHLVFGNERPTLVKSHMRDFNKNLRRQLEYYDLLEKRVNEETGELEPVPLKCMFAGEYGETYGRPHYHGIYCGLNIPDLKFFGMNFDGDCYYTSEFLSKIWKKGFITIGQADWRSCAYVGRYVMKKHKGKDFHYYADNFIAPEFVQSSMKMGENFYEEFKSKIFSDDEIIIPDKHNGFRTIKPPKTFDKWFEAESPEEFEKLKQHRQDNARDIMKQELSNTDLLLDDYLETKERNFLVRVGALKRSLKV